MTEKSSLNNHDTETASNRSAAPRRAYKAPELTTFGSVEEFTRGTGSGAADFRGGGRVKN